MEVTILKVRAHILVSGKVQGVFFRSETRDEANRLGVQGWVRNLSDGRVEAILEGDEEAVEAVVDFLREGPLYARVDDVEFNWEAYRGDFKNFRIRPTV